ncbi:hypothetical protein ACIG5E_22905 [Kitasatospora sp. NPDC053057]|uniref:hypothetical protein n=1 Tax=Kitasatospora sp. NPDC053057 TaxID=3364062 RepID=UPI0037CA2863
MDTDEFWAVIAAAKADTTPARPCAARPPLPELGEDFDFDDPVEMHRRLPRLAALFLGPADCSADCSADGPVSGSAGREGR